MLIDVQVSLFVILAIIGKKNKNAFKLLKNAFRTKVSNKIKMNPFNNAEQDTSKLFLSFFKHFFFVVMHKDSNTFVVVVVVVELILNP